MKVALYLRKSTDEQADSIETQRAGATAFAVAKGWSVASEFIDSGISRAEFAPAKRPGFYDALRTAREHVVDAIIVRDLSRFGGDLFRAGALAQELLESGARLFTYVDGKEIPASNAMECMILAFQLFGAHDEREKVSSRTREALHRKAEAGLVAGGKVYGYANVPSKTMKSNKRGGFVPDHYTYAIDEAQAAIVRDVFKRYGNGDGVKRIARDLNLRGVSSARGNGWHSSMINSLVHNERYRGVLIWGERRKTYRGGTKVRDLVPEAERTRVDAPHLRIIDEDLWALVHAKNEANAERSRAQRGATGGRSSTSLLCGFLRCGTCGGGFTASGRTRKSYRSVAAYVCTSFFTKRRPRIGRREYDPATRNMVEVRHCSNSVVRPVEDVDAAVLGWLGEHLLRDGLMESVVRDAREVAAARSAADEADFPRLRAEAATLTKQIGNLTSAISEAETAEARAPLSSALHQKQLKLQDTQRQLTTRVAASRAVDAELANLQQAVAARLGQLREVLAAGDAAGLRPLLLSVFGPKGIVASPEEVPFARGGERPGKRLELSASASLAAGFTATVEPTTREASPAGFEPA